MLLQIKKFIKELNDFYPTYLKAHSDVGNRILHFIGSTLFFTLIVIAFILKIWWLILAAVFIGYFLPGIGHKFFQHNNSFRASKPVLCVLCAFRLYIDLLSFRTYRKMKKETQYQ
jgi:hypothetical protein